MSYEIVYSKQFIKTKDFVVPMVLTGSNNCTTISDSGREIRERDWMPLSNKLVGLTAQQLVAETNKWLGGEYQQHFMMNGKWVDDDGLVRFIKNGINGALTISEIKEKSGRSTRCALSIWKNHERTEELLTYAKTDEEFENWLTSAMERVANKKDDEQIYYDIGWECITPLGIRKQAKIDGKCLAKIRGHYYAHIEDNDCRWCSDKQSATIFDSIKQAQEKLTELNNNFGNIVYVKYTNRVATPKEKNFAIQYYGNYGKVFMRKHTRNTLKGCFYASDIKQKFETYEKAQKFIDETMRGFDVKDIQIVDLRTLEKKTSA